MRAVLLCLLLGAALVPWPGAPAQSTVNLTIEALESGCPSGKTFCFKETSGNLDDVQPGSVVTVSFMNKGSSPHEVSVVSSAKADPEHKATKKSDAIGQSEANIEGGGSDEFQFTVPADAERIYLWCSVAGHEQLGMWLEQEAPTTSGGNSPGLGVFALFVALGAAMVVLAGRRN